MAENSFTPEQIQAMNAFTDALNASTRSLGPKAEADREAAEAADAAKKQLQNFGKQIGRSAIDVTKNMVSGGEGTGKFAGAVTTASEAAGDLAQKFGPLGYVVGGLIKIFGQVAAASLKQNDTIMKAYRDLSEAGDVGGSLEKLKDDLGKVGLTSDEVEKFGAMIKKHTPDVAAFGGSVTAGKDKLIGVIQGMIGPDNQIERAMSRIGYGAEEMRDATADYIAKQSRLGISQAKTEGQLRDESVKYMTTLRELQELTGMSRDEAQKLMDQQQNEYRFAEHIRQLEMSGKKEEADNLRKYMASYEKTFGHANATDLMEQIVNKGQAVGEASQRAMLSTQNRGYENAIKAQKGQIDMYDGLKDTAAGMRRNMNSLGDAYNIQGQQLNQLSGSNEGLIGMQMMEGKTREEIMKQLMADQAKSGDRLDQNTRMEQQQRAMRISADRALWDVGSATVSIFSKINTVVFAFGKGLATIIDFITAIVPFVKKTNYADSFKSNSDVQNEKAGVMREREQLLAEKERLNKELETNSVDKATLAKQIQASQTEITQMQKDAKGLKGEEAERARLAIAEKQRELREQEQLAREIANGNTEKAILERKKKITEIEERLQAEDKRLQELEKENVETGGTNPTPQGPMPKYTNNNRPPPTGSTADKIIYNESNGDASAQSPTSTAYGLGQFTKGTFEDVAKTKGSSVYGKSWQDYKSSPEIQRAALDDLIKLNQNKLSSQGIGVTDTATYLAHFLGAGGATKLYKAGNDALLTSVVTANQMAANQAVFQGMRTVKDLKIWAAHKMGEDEKVALGDTGKGPQAKLGGVFDGPKSGYSVTLHGKEAVVPMPNMTEFIDGVKKESLASLSDMQSGNMKPNMTMTPNVDLTGLERIMSETLVGKFEDMIRQLETANDKLGDILKHAKV
jgi:hypothetical protein